VPGGERDPNSGNRVPAQHGRKRSFHASRTPGTGTWDTLSDCRAPSPAAWAEAGILSGTLARTQLHLARPKSGLSTAEECCQKGKRRKLLNDVLIVLTARERGAILVSSNVADMDLLLRFRPDTRLLLYRQTSVAA